MILPPPPPGPLSPAYNAARSPSELPPSLSLEETSKNKSSGSEKEESKEPQPVENQSPQDAPDEDFGDFQTAG